MADYPVGRTDFLDDQLPAGTGRLTLDGFHGGTAQWTQEAGRIVLEALTWDTPAGGAWSRLPGPQKAAVQSNDRAGTPLPTGPEEDWFGHVFVLPGSINAGLVLTLEVFTLSLYSSYKDVDRSLDTFTNNVGTGVSLIDLPALPETIPPQSGFDVTLHIEPEGPAFVSGTLDFGFDTLTLAVSVNGQRTILLPHQPEKPLIESLIWATDIRRGRSGAEQRAALRHTPRSRLELTVRVDGAERRRLENNLIDSQARLFAVPVWYEPARLQADISVDDTAITVDSTDYASFNPGSLAIVWAAYNNFEALEIDTVGATSLTFTTPFTKTFAAGALVMPVRAGKLRSENISGQRWPVNLQEHKLVLVTTDNEQDLSDTSAFSSFNGKVLLDDPNLISGTMRESMTRNITVIDNTTGKFDVFSEQDISRRTHPKTFLTNSREDLWNVRRLLHALRGRHVSLYIPTFFDDLIVTDTVASADTTLTVENVGYTQFIQSRQPRNVIRLTKTDGTTVIRTVTSSAEIDDTEEQLTVDSAWGVNATPAEIDRVDFVEKVRLDTDEVRIEHRDALGQAVITAPVRAVLE